MLHIAGNSQQFAGNRDLKTWGNKLPGFFWGKQMINIRYTCIWNLNDVIRISYHQREGHKCLRPPKVFNYHDTSVQ
jgi:hypothetical protein